MRPDEWSEGFVPEVPNGDSIPPECELFATGMLPNGDPPRVVFLRFTESLTKCVKLSVNMSGFADEWDIRHGMNAARILVAEDDPAIRELIVHHLEREGYLALAAVDGATALRKARAGVELIILDVGLPGVNGFDITRTLRLEGFPTPILMLTARCDELDRVVGFELGADDYVQKPFSPREVVARVAAILRRCNVEHDPRPRVLRFGRLEVDSAAREARVDGRDLALKPREFSLLHELASNSGVAISRMALLERVWGFDFDGDARTVDVHVRRLRKRIEEGEKIPAMIHTVRGHGYKFIPQ
jgi:DNA-binding response OmpR family regulator